MQIYNPSFAPDTCGGTLPYYCYHENDGSFGGTGAPDTAYSAMEYTLFQVSTLSSRLSDTKIGQEIFYPYNATNLAAVDGTCPGGTPYSYSYFNPPTSGAPTPTKVCVTNASVSADVPQLGFRAELHARERQ